VTTKSTKIAEANALSQSAWRATTDLHIRQLNATIDELKRSVRNLNNTVILTLITSLGALITNLGRGGL